MTSIQSIRKTVTSYFGEVNTENFWLKEPADSASQPDTDFLTPVKNLLDSGIENRLICVFTESLSSSAVCESLAKTCHKGSRVYILTNAYHNEMEHLGGCLIRYGGGKRMGSFILVNPNSDSPSGCFFTGLLSDGSLQHRVNLFLDLDREQVQVLYRYFCYQFWKKTEKERIGSDEHEISGAPVDIYPPRDNSCDFQYLQSVWSKAAQEAVVSAGSLTAPYLKVDNLSNSRVLTLLSQAKGDVVQALHEKNNEVTAFDDVSLVCSVKNADGLWLIPKIDVSAEQEVYALLLKDPQKQKLETHLQSLVHGKERYTYMGSMLRKDLSGKTILKLGDPKDKEYQIEPEGRSKPELPAPQELLSKEDKG